MPDTDMYLPSSVAFVVFYVSVVLFRSNILNNTFYYHDSTFIIANIYIYFIDCAIDVVGLDLMNLM